MRKLLRSKLKADGYRLRWDGYRSLSLWRRGGLVELAKSFSISIDPLSHKYDAQSLVPEVVRLMEEGRDVFSLTSEVGDGKAVLGMLMPLLCQRSPHAGCAVLYLSHSDWARGGPLVKGRVKNWLASWPNNTHRLLVIDSASELLYDAALRGLVVELREDPQYICGFLFLCRPATPGKTGDIALALAALFQKQALEMKLHFDPAQAAQCRVFRHLFPRVRLNEHQLSHLLLA